MTREEKELLLKDLCARLPYWVFVNVTEPGDSSTNYDCLLSTDILEVSGKTSNLNYKPYLRPMSSMTEDEQQKYYDLTHQEEDDVWGKCLFDKMVDFCNENHLDYRGLIEKGLALEAPEDMYKDR